MPRLLIPIVLVLVVLGVLFFLSTLPKEQPTKPIEGTSSECWIEQNPPYYQELARRHASAAKEVG